MHIPYTLTLIALTLYHSLLTFPLGMYMPSTRSPPRSAAAGYISQRGQSGLEHLF